MDNNKEMVRGVSRAVISNGVSLLGSVLMTLILPRFIGVTEYGYYQLYIFYVGYIGFLGIGWHEGAYLRTGGKYWKEIDFPCVSGQFRMYSFMELVLSLVICVVGILLCGADKDFIVFMVCVCVVVYLPRAFLHNLLQATGRISEYANGIMIDKIVHIAIALFGVLLREDNFEWFVVGEVIGRICGGIYIFIVCKDLVVAKPLQLKGVKEEAKRNISCGIVLMLSNVASMLIVGIMRQAIEICWDIETFGKMSLALSLTNFVVAFIGAVAMVLFPYLRRSDADKRKEYYEKISCVLMLLVLGALVFYYPGKVLLMVWLPAYEESLNYMAMLFVVCVYESKMAMLLNTYMKTLREERRLLIYNAVSVAISFVLALVSCYVVHDLELAAMSIVVVQAIRSTLVERYVGKKIGHRVVGDILVVHLLVAIFIISNWRIGGCLGMVIYLISYTLFLVNKRTQAKDIFANLIKR